MLDITLSQITSPVVVSIFAGAYSFLLSTLFQFASVSLGTAVQVDPMTAIAFSGAEKK